MTSAPDVTPVVYPAAPTGLVRPAVILGICVAIAAGLSIYFGHPLFAVFFLIGTLGALINAKLVVRAVGTIANEANPRKQVLAAGSVVRVGILTCLALTAAIVFRPDGLGVMFGLAVGQVILVLNTVIPVLKGLRKQL